MTKIELKGDSLDRGLYARSLYRIIDKYTVKEVEKEGKTVLEPVKRLTNTDNDAFIMAISAPWGFGKTHFIKLFEKVLQKDESVITQGMDYFPDSGKISQDNIIRYDAWKNDFWDNSLEPLYDAILNSKFNGVTQKDVEEQNYTDKLLKPLKGTLKLTMKGVLSYAMMLPMVAAMPDVVKDDIKELPDKFFDYIDGKDNGNDYAKSAFPEYAQFRDAINELKKNLSGAVQAKGKLVIIIDELDRCKPTFAVQTLEIVKHLFNVSNIVFIFSLDINQLQYCVQRVYGEKFDAVVYLERFFDYTTLLPQGNMENFFKQTIKFFYDKAEDPSNPEFMEETTEENMGQTEKDCLEVYYQICTKFHLSAREIRAVCSSFHFLDEFELEGYPSHAKQLYFYLLVMKYKKPIEVTISISNSSEAEKCRNQLMDDYPPVFKPDKDNCKKFIEAFKANEVIGEYKEYIRIYEGGDGDDMTKSLAEIENLFTGSLSYALYAPDYKIKEDIKTYRLLEYLFRKVELYDTAIKE